MNPKEQKPYMAFNSMQNAGAQGTLRLNEVGNLTVISPTVAQMNQAIRFHSAPIAERADDAAFGSNIREARAIISDWIRS